ncbi:MAG: ferredoxin [Candidatus Daviesbacteria bacterium]|nr:ferredoxin [Candidatus Daviesbacteria bacterium]
MSDKTKTYQAGDVKISIKRPECISCSSCVFMAPKTFELDGESISVVKEEGPYDDAKTIEEAAASCPTTAIVVEK